MRYKSFRMEGSARLHVLCVSQVSSKLVSFVPPNFKIKNKIKVETQSIANARASFVIGGIDGTRSGASGHDGLTSDRVGGLQGVRRMLTTVRQSCRPLQFLDKLSSQI